MNKNKRYFFVSFVVVFLLVFMFTVINKADVSYAIPTGVERAGIPKESFTSNVTNNRNINYIEEALSANGLTHSNSFLFDVKVMKTNDNKTPLYSLMKNLEIPMTTENFEIFDDNPINVADKGIMYILGHGYSSSNTENDIFKSMTYGSVTNNDLKYYLTQIALWLYIYENNVKFSSTYCANEACTFNDSTSKLPIAPIDIRNFIKNLASVNGYKYLNYIILLVDNAEAYTGAQESKISVSKSSELSYQINSDFTLLTTDTISVAVDSNKLNYMYYSVEIEDNNKYGVYITDSNGVKIENTNVMNGSFRIAVPLKEDITEMDLSSIKVLIKGHFMTNEGYEYRVTSTSPDNKLINDSKNQKYTNVLLGYIPSEMVSNSLTLYNFTKVSKIDVTSSKELPGATLEITNKNDETQKEKWVSTDKPHYIYLDNGDYTLCETIAPKGYSLNTECVDFTVDGKSIKYVSMENEPEVPIPNTGLFGSKTLYFIGGGLTLLGLLGFILASKKNDFNKY